MTPTDMILYDKGQKKLLIFTWQGKREVFINEIKTVWTANRDTGIIIYFKEKRRNLIIWGISRPSKAYRSILTIILPKARR